ncbi:MAG: heme ABC transporter ATP-binding protein [Kofleriaceae bacterium]
MTVLAARGLSVHAGRAVLLDEVDLAIAAGELVSIVGPNGAGKSTLLGALAGDRRPTRGAVVLHGRDLTTLSVAELARSRAVLPQRSQLALAFTAIEVVQLAGPTIDRALARRCLADVALEPFADRVYPSLSGGEQQRVQLARVLAQLAASPRAALLLDEPTSALDPRHQRIVLGLARRAAAAGHAVVVVVHDLTLAARWCDRVVLLAGGRLVADGPPGAVFTAPALAAAYETPFELLTGEAGLVVVS